MRLIDTQTHTLLDFDPDRIPKYAILSHTWSAQEISFSDYEATAVDTESRYAKIRSSCKQAASDGYCYIWIDTCCIDKSSSAELSEAINSMYPWYRGAGVCYAFLTDVQKPDAFGHGPGSLRASRWFTRGWTLQELLAPADVRFFDRHWCLIGTKIELSEMISEVTRIDLQILRKERHVHSASIAQRMSWASIRATRRPEDIAYCLMGILNVNMPMLYGEGQKAFIRLQEEVMKNSDDQSLFAWADLDDDGKPSYGLLARHPRAFKDSGNFEPRAELNDCKPHFLTSRGVSINVFLTPAETLHRDLMSLGLGNKLAVSKAVLRCAEFNRPNRFAAISLLFVDEQNMQFVRIKPQKLERTTLQGDPESILVRPRLFSNTITRLETHHFYLAWAKGTQDAMEILWSPAGEGAVKPFNSEEVYAALYELPHQHIGSHTFYEQDLTRFKFPLPLRPRMLALILIVKVSDHHLVLQLGTNSHGQIGIQASADERLDHFPPFEPGSHVSTEEVSGSRYRFEFRFLDDQFAYTLTLSMPSLYGPDSHQDCKIEMHLEKIWRLNRSATFASAAARAAKKLLLRQTFRGVQGPGQHHTETEDAVERALSATDELVTSFSHREGPPKSAGSEH